MPTAAWQPGTLYIPGSLVKPRTTVAVTQSEPTNSDFEAGASGWTLGTGFSIGQFGAAFNGTWSLKYDQNDPAVQVTLNNNVVPVTPGLNITASCQVQQGGSSSGQAGGTVLIRWYDATMTLLLEQLGNAVNSGSGGQWKLSQVNSIAPANAAFAQVGIGMFRLSGSSPVFADVFIWNYTYSGPTEALLYKAVQSLSGYSAASEPVWPIVVGNQVVDNEVTWEAVNTTSRVVYEAHPILKSGATEPDFPDAIGATVADNTIVWEATARQITDAKCPNSPIVVTAASKIFAADGDIISFSATTNPLDWSTKDDAGFLPFGLQKFGSEPITGMGLYRSNLVAFNSAGAQMWQIDEDPTNNALLDAVPVGCRYHKSIQPVMNDLGFLTDIGIRNFGIAAASTNLQAGDLAKAIDVLVKEAIKTGYEPIGLFFPGTGQYMLFFGSEAFVLTWNGVTARAVSRSRYTFPSAIDNWTILDGALYLRTGDIVWKFDDDTLVDDFNTGPITVVSMTPEAGGGGLGVRTEEFFIPGVDPSNFIGSFDPEPAVLFEGPRRLVGFVYNNSSSWYEVTVNRPDLTFVIPFDRIEFTGDDGERVILRVSEALFVQNATNITVFFSLPVKISVGNTYELSIHETDATEGTEFEGYMAWPYLELQGLGDDVMLHGFDLVGEGEVAVSFGYDQNNLTYATDAYTVQAETVSGQPIAMPIKAPSVQLRLTFSANQHWKWHAARLYDSPVNS